MMRNRLILWMKVIIQVICLVVFTELFVSAFNGIGRIYGLILDQDYNLSKIGMFLTPVLLLTIISILFGRFFCGWLCAFGAINDFIFYISKKVVKRRFLLPQKLDTRLRYLKYFSLLIIILFAWTFEAIPVEEYSPWTAFEEMDPTLGVIFNKPMAFILLVLILIGAMLIERFFCRYLCPLGAIQAVLSGINLSRIRKSRTECTGCKSCSSNCPMGITSDSTGMVKNTECIRCMQCAESCSGKNMKVYFLNNKFSSLLFCTTAIGTFIILSLPLGTWGPATPEQQRNAVESTELVSTEKVIAKDSSKSKTDKKFRDGVYQGTARGRRPGLTVSVTIKEDRIEKIEVVSHRESKGYFETPVKVIPNEIVSSQSTEVDAVSGATRTSDGIMNAVKDALKKAKVP
ncbi:MAG: 4Fe-4S binding protein [Clostridia bacterium]|nr:4Fe-4S binding protein [Clostridia bacterium]